ncbi:hypothetical protein AAIR98_001281 [Elusimicrobium simillimum]|uniref:hypothetical protein n=1 Tax=Elusimicrobium simillimum TaxID=3143438 RepID=UPI003C6FBE2D
MANNFDRNVRVKFKLRTGEEFEAEGNEGFITEQKNDFLTLVGKTTPNFASHKTPQTKAEAPAAAPHPSHIPAYSTPSDFGLPREMRKPAPAPATPLSPSAGQQTLTKNISNTIITDTHSVWNNALRIEGDLVIIRRKFKLLSPSLAALIIVAGAKVLLKESAYPALKLAKSMKLSGFMEGADRLDRLTAVEVKQGTLAFEGTKRNRAYKVSDEGFARAFVLAEKLI